MKLVFAFLCCLMTAFASSTATVAEELPGTWHAQFETFAGVQTYHFQFDLKDGSAKASAVVEMNDEKREVMFTDVKVDSNMLTFVEQRKLQDREIRIDYSCKLTDDGLSVSRKVGDFGTVETKAFRKLPDAPPATPPAPAVEVRIDHLIKDVFQNEFLIGMAGDVPARYSETELAAATKHFNAVTPENCMKPERVHPAEDRWQFETSDALVEWAQANRMSIHGHTLVWHAQTPNWFFENADRTVATQRMKDHILTLVGRYKGKLQSWDVVNEAINDGGNDETAKTEGLRNSPWLQAMGPDYLTLAFRFAHEADPAATLYYNDYNIESGPKHASSMVLLKRLLSEGAPVHAVGIQGHWRSGSVPFDDIDNAISDYASLGLKVSITELDVTIRGAAGGQFGGGQRAGRNQPPASAEDLARQADDYAKLFAIFRKHKDAIERVTFWGLHDRRTWRFGQHPLILDANSQPKPAYAAIVNEK